MTAHTHSHTGEGFREVADRVWVARYAWFDVNVTLVGGALGLLVVDTHGSGAAAREVLHDVRRLGAGEVVGVVNTHWHFDHTFGNATFREAYGEVPVHAHENARDELERWGERLKQRVRDHEGEDPHRDEVLATEIVLPDQTFSSARVVDLGDRAVELVHPGRGHTSGDLVLRVPDADVLLAGDLVEESAPPSMNDDAWPMDWPLTLDVVLGLTTPATVVVPGHGLPVDRDFVETQRGELGIVAETIRDLAGRGIPVEEAVQAADWPWERERLETAVRRGYEQLPRSQKRLPLV
ncbi:MBL fold metallo-hydrolase [Nocardioides panaciterrulae]|uniref:Glyoxylase-like metal-dependent hydrolase (Beta-lactamase superfamily II) n=1 Tax=Nocardioides panaciterrulae TaxID=661492 RepID=A0A7Y9JA66_9ACTN|nr:MBL fold metallo-hydrolase [Nocardioides panaciterrulae]NYD41362.1 glyoxylase-like metal-dependent hydrolase (beta-lactamase superfamily II) [Nocardioides panaciterrulae]